MRNHHSQEHASHGGAAGLAPTERTTPSSSRMLTSYLADIEELLDEHRWEAALRDAFELPRMAVALSDPQMRTRPELVTAWCQQWIRPEDPDRSARGLDFERVSTLVDEHSKLDGGSSADTVPTRALRRLRLRRLARRPPRGFSALTSDATPEGSDALQTCTILVNAARRWYAQMACHDATVQANLARLAVLR